MTQRIIHPERLAWDCARAFVALVDVDRDYFWLSAELARLLGEAYGLALSDTRSRVLWQPGGNAVNIEAGLWRARLQDLLSTRPELTAALESVMYEARSRAAEPYPIAG